MKDYLFVTEQTDKRMRILADSLLADGFMVEEYCMGGLSINVAKDRPCEVCYLFSPAKKWRDGEIESLRNGSTVAAGRLSYQDIMLLEEKKIKYISLVADDVFTVKNSILTAEASLVLIITETEGSLYEEKFLITGYGKLANAQAKLFSDLGLDFAICARNPKDRAAALIYTQKVFSTELDLSPFTVIVNTVPAEVFSEETVSTAKEGCVFVELASARGVSEKNAKKYGLHYIGGPALPGKYCPKAAAGILKQVLLKNL